jgi:hypothetical protein
VVDGEFAITVLQAQRGVAVKKRTRSAHGQLTKSDPTLNELHWRLRQHRTEADVDRIARFLNAMAPRHDLATVHGDPAPGVDPNQCVRRLSAESHGSNRTIVEAARSYIPIDLDDATLPQGSALGDGQNLFGLAEYARETFLPPSLRHVDLAIGAASSTGFKSGRGSLHAYAVLDRPTPLAVIYKWLAGAKASGLPLDPRPALPGQLFLTGRPLLFGLDDPVPPFLHAFVLPGWRQRVTSIDWNEFSAPLADVVGSERRARIVGTELGWRVVLARYLGDGGGRLGFFKPLSIALGYAARSGESADEIVSDMHAIVAAHPDLNAERAGQYTPQWLRRELLRLRAKDASRAARSDAIRHRLLPTMSFDR